MTKKKILIIDDEMDMGEVVRDYLKDQGYEAFMTLDAVQGLEIVDKEKPDVVLLDILMPQISGMECLQQILQKNPKTIVLMVSGMQDEQIAKEAIRYGAYDYITKPFDLDYLQNSLLKRIFG